MSLFGKKELITEIEALKLENTRLKALGLAQAEEIKVELESLLSKVDALNLLNINQTSELENEKIRHGQYVEATDAKLKEVQSESELLLLQLHQVQEELESVFLKEQEAQNQIQSLNQASNILNQDKFNLSEIKTKLDQEKNTLNETIATLIHDKGNLNQEKTALNEQLNQQIQLANERQLKIDSLTQLLDGTQKDAEEKNDKLKIELEKSNQMINTLNQDKTKISNEKNKILESLDILTKEKTLIIQERDEQIKLSSERQTKIDSMSKLIDGQLKEVQEENELLLLQLHQVQEELEHHFLEHQKLQRDNEILTSRWKRLEKREPQYLDYESVFPVVVDTVSSKPKVEWLANEITIAGKVTPQLHFTTFLEDGMPGIEISETSKDGDESAHARLIPRALVKPNAAKMLAQYRNMSMKNWQLLTSGMKAVEQFFKSPKQASLNQKLPDFFDLVFWRQTLAPLVADFKALPAVFRFDGVKLKREQINPDYEHLWLEFEGASFGHYQWPALEIRFAAANVQPGGFSRRPKIEIPKISNSTSPFDSWFEESQDDFGAKMELRFDLNKQFFDLDVWSRVTPEDRAMLISLIGSTPFILKTLEDVGTKISRPWEQWNSLASGMVEILRRIITEAEKIAKEANETKVITAPSIPIDSLENDSAQSISKEKLSGESVSEIMSTENVSEGLELKNNSKKRFAKKRR